MHGQAIRRGGCQVGSLACSRPDSPGRKVGAVTGQFAGPGVQAARRDGSSWHFRASVTRPRTHDLGYQAL